MASAKKKWNRSGAKNGKEAKTPKLSEQERIDSDIRQFHENAGEVKLTDETRDVVEIAKQYCEDTRYFLGKKDYVTAFGCINYAHGLIDAYRKKWREG